MNTNNPIDRRTFIKSSALLAAPSVLSACNRSSAVEKQAGIVPLFDGVTLDGWHKNPKKIGHGTGGLWEVQDGTIAGGQDPPGSGNGGILLSNRTYGNFELLIDIKPDWGCCSGLFFRSTEKGQCFQMMVDYHEDGNVGHIYGEGIGGFDNRPFDIFGKYDGGGKLIGLKSSPRPGSEDLPPAYSISGERFCEIYKVDDWNRVKVRCIGANPKLTIWINGEKITEFDATTFNRKGYDKKKVATTLGIEGHIALQVHAGNSWPAAARCRWRNINIRTL